MRACRVGWHSDGQLDRWAELWVGLTPSLQPALHWGQGSVPSRAVGSRAGLHGCLGSLAHTVGEQGAGEASGGTGLTREVRCEWGCPGRPWGGWGQAEPPCCRPSERPSRGRRGCKTQPGEESVARVRAAARSPGACSGGSVRVGPWTQVGVHFERGTLVLVMGQVFVTEAWLRARTRRVPSTRQKVGSSGCVCSCRSGRLA